MKFWKKKKEIPWYNQGYIDWPEGLDSVAFVMSKGKEEDVIARITKLGNGSTLMNIETNTGTYLNQIRASIIW